MIYARAGIYHKNLICVRMFTYSSSSFRTATWPNMKDLMATDRPNMEDRTPGLIRRLP